MRRIPLITASLVILLGLVAPVGLAGSRPSPVGFARPIPYIDAEQTDPWAVAVADFNRDGRPDLAVANAFTSDVSILVGQGDGTFKAGGIYAVDGPSPTALVSGDFNGDRAPDLAVANGYASNVSILLGAGDGTFAAVTSYDTGSLPEKLAVGDLNADGKPDLVVPNVNSDDLSVLMGKGDGAFSPAVTSNPGGALNGPFSAAIGDLNRDGAQDIVVSNLGSTTLSVLLGNGSGVFALARNVTVGSYPGSVAIGDFNADGIPDLVAARASMVSVVLGKGDGTFREPATYATGAAPQQVAVADLNGDRALDLVTVNFDSDRIASSVSVLLGVGNGTFTGHKDLPAERGSISIAIADLNTDRRPDLAIASFFSNSVSTYLQRAVACRVPALRGATVGRARQLIAAAHCSLGTIGRAFSSKVRQGRVISQHPRPGSTITAGGSINLVVSRGKKPR